MSSNMLLSQDLKTRSASVSHQASRASVSKALSEEELDLLESLLNDLSLTDLGVDSFESKSSLSLDAVDGLFVALALSPRNTAIADWMSLVMGDARFEDKEKTQVCRNLLVHHYQQVVYLLRKTDMQTYFPCVSLRDESEDSGVDVSTWCAGFAMGYELQQEAWDERLDEMALSELNLILAFKDELNEEEFDLLDESESQLREAQRSLIEIMQAEISDLLDEPADELTMLLFVLKGLQSVMLTSPIKEKNTIKSVKNPHSSKNNTKPSYRAKTNATTYKG